MGKSISAPANSASGILGNDSAILAVRLSGGTKVPEENVKQLAPDTSPLLEAVHMATQRLATSGNVDSVLKDVLSICVEAVGAGGGTIYLHEPAARRLRFLHVLPEEAADSLPFDIPDDFGTAGNVFHSGKIEVNAFKKGNPEAAAIERASGIQTTTMITVPLQIEGLPPIGVIQLINKDKGEFTETDEQVLDTVSDICALSILNHRLLDRRRRVSSLEGMGRAAHDLANKAGVLMTFLPEFQRNLDGLREALDKAGSSGEVCMHLEMLESTFSDVFSPYSERVYRYARLINDLAANKKVKPKLSSQSLARVVDEAVDFMRPQAQRAHVALKTDLNWHAPEIETDELFVIRIVENLVGNAIKAVADTIPEEWRDEHSEDREAVYGTVTVKVTVTDDAQVITVEDEGPGMPPRIIRSILNGRMGTGWQRGEGTGLGTKVVLDLTNALGGKIDIDSKLGEGSSFRIELPAETP